MKYRVSFPNLGNATIESVQDGVMSATLGGKTVTAVQRYGYGNTPLCTPRVGQKISISRQQFASGNWGYYLFEDAS